MTAVSNSELLQLSDSEICRTIQEKDIYQKMSFSLISGRCKRLVRSLQIRAKRISVTIGASICITIHFWGSSTKIYFKHSTENQKRRLRAPKWVEADQHRLERTGFSYSNWLKHLQAIFHHPCISDIGIFLGSSVFDLDQIKKVFGACEYFFARNTGCVTKNQMLFQKFHPIENLIIDQKMFQDSKIPWNILLQNYASLEIRSDNSTEMTLDELLTMNSKRITMQNVRVSPQNVNKFIKLWMKGSNPRLEYFMILFENRFQYDRTMVMNGIATSNQRREGSDLHRMDVYRMDGTRATISFFIGGVEIFMEF